MQSLKYSAKIAGYAFLLFFLYLSPAVAFLVGLDFLYDPMVSFNNVSAVEQLIGAFAVVYSIRVSLEV